MLHIQGKKTGDIITFKQFQEGNSLSENRNDMESDDESDDDSNLKTLISEEEMDARSSGDESDAEPMSTDMLDS